MSRIHSRKTRGEAPGHAASRFPLPSPRSTAPVLLSADGNAGFSDFQNGLVGR